MSVQDGAVAFALAQPPIPFVEMAKIPRLSRDIVITEKIDGTNASIYIPEDGGQVLFGSRTRWITPATDNFGFATWATANLDQLLTLGPGHHFGEWWGQGIQRGYDLTEKRFSLFNVKRWGDPASRPACVHVVPVLYRGSFDTAVIDTVLETLAQYGSNAAPGFLKPEGIIVYHTAGNLLFKKTLDKNDGHKGER